MTSPPLYIFGNGSLENHSLLQRSTLQDELQRRVHRILEQFHQRQQGQRQEGQVDHPPDQEADQVRLEEKRQEHVQEESPAQLLRGRGRDQRQHRQRDPGERDLRGDRHLRGILRRSRLRQRRRGHPTGQQGSEVHPRALREDRGGDLFLDVDGRPRFRRRIPRGQERHLQLSDAGIADSLRQMGSSVTDFFRKRKKMFPPVMSSALTFLNPL